ELRSARSWMVKLERDLPDEAGSDRATGNARHGHLPHAHVRERCVIDRIVGEPGEELARERPGDDDRPALRGEVDDVRTEAEPVCAVTQPGLNRIAAAGGRRELPALLAQRTEQPVVEDVAGLIEGEQVASAARP